MPTSPSPSEAVVPWTGESVDLAIVENAARMLDSYRRFQQEYGKSFAEACADRLREESDLLGMRTFERDGWKVEVESADSAVKTEWDVDALWDGLVRVGLPLDRLQALITYQPVVNGTVLRQLRRNPAYAVIIDAAKRSEKPRSRYVKVSKHGT